MRPILDRVVVSATRVPFNRRLSGLHRMLWRQFRNAAIVFAITMSLLVVMGSMPWSRTPGLLEQIRQSVSTMPAEIGGQMWVLGWILYFTIGMRRWQPGKVPLLRTLPVSSREINVMLLMRAVVTCVAFWLALLPIYVLSPAASHPWMGLACSSR